MVHGGQVIGEDMVHASTVSEYLSIKGASLTLQQRDELHTYEDERGADVPVDTFTHSMVSMVEGNRVCTWSPKMQDWFFEKDGQRWACSLKHG